MRSCNYGDVWMASRTCKWVQQIYAQAVANHTRATIHICTPKKIHNDGSHISGTWSRLGFSPCIRIFTASAVTSCLRDVQIESFSSEEYRYNRCVRKNAEWFFPAFLCISTDTTNAEDAGVA